MNNYFNSFKLEEFLIGIILLSLPIHSGINSIVIIVTTLFFLYKKISKGSFNSLVFYSTSFIFFLAQLISYLISTNKQEAGVKLLLFASFLLFPMCFSYLSNKKIKLDENKIFKFLFYGVIVILVYGSIRFLFDILLLNERYDYGRGVALLLRYIPHHIYMSMFILISIYTIFVGRIESGENRKSIYMLPVLYLFLILLSSRMAILLGVVVLPLFLFKKLKSKKGNKKIVLFGSLFALIILIVGFSNDFVRDKIIYSYYDLMNITTNEKPFFGISFRQQIWSNVFDLIYQYPFWGYGVGDTQEILNGSFKNKALIGLNAHNQYFQLILHHGIIIFSTLCSFTIVVIKQCIINKKSILLFSWLILFFFSFTESILNRQWGVVLFAFILNYSIYSNNLKYNNT